MRLARGVALFALVAASAALSRPALGNDAASGSRTDPVRAITSQLICPCSCGEILSGCTCETGVALKGYVGKELEKGKDRKAIEASLIAKYGEVILGAPKAKGFNLLVWVAPFVATLAGFGIATMILVRWVRRKPAGASARAAGGGGLDPTDPTIEDLRARAEAELRELKR